MRIARTTPTTAPVTTIIDSARSAGFARSRSSKSLTIGSPGGEDVARRAEPRRPVLPHDVGGAEVPRDHAPAVRVAAQERADLLVEGARVDRGGPWRAGVANRPRVGALRDGGEERPRAADAQV